VAQIVKVLDNKLSQSESKIVELAEVSPLLKQLDTSYSQAKPPELSLLVEELSLSEGFIFVIPEYNGSFPGILKYFVDQWKYPETFLYRPACFIGLGGIFGGLRSVEHFQQVMAYRNSFLYPDRVFIQNIFKELVATEEAPGFKLASPLIHELLENQISGFSKFVEALKATGLHANFRAKPSS
jgi:NAD(P)H-dependent FMN reductase